MIFSFKHFHSPFKATMKSARLLILAALCVSAMSGCATNTQLANSVQPPRGKTADQIKLDNSACEDEARAARESPANLAKAFLLGATIIGAPWGLQQGQSDARQAYVLCMTKREYAVQPATD